MNYINNSTQCGKVRISPLYPRGLVTKICGRHVVLCVDILSQLAPSIPYKRDQPSDQYSGQITNLSVSLKWSLCEDN